MAVELDPTVLPVMHKKARPVRRSLVVRMLGGAFLGFSALLCFWLFVLPVVVVALSSVAAHWSGTILPDGFSTRWFERLGSSDFDAITTSLEIGIGVAVLIAYHKRPFDLSSSAAIVVFVQLALVLPFCYRCAAAALRPELTILREAAPSRGAPPSMVLRTVVLPQLVPPIRASLALGFALSLRELGATLTVYPPGFATVPIVVVGQVERGYYLPASALALILLLVSLAALLLIAARVPKRRA